MNMETHGIDIIVICEIYDFIISDERDGTFIFIRI